MPYSGPPSNRIAWDRDGSVLLLRKSARYGGGWINAHPNAMKAANSSNNGGMFIPMGDPASLWKDNRAQETETAYDRLALIFPEPMLLTGIFVQTLYRTFPNSFGANRGWDSTPAEIRASQDTTNGEDGDWKAVFGEFLSMPVGYVQLNPPYGTVSGVRIDTGATQTIESVEVKSHYRHLKSITGVGIQPVNQRNVRGITIDMYSRRGLTGSYDGEDRIAMFLHLYGYPDTLSEGRVLAAWHPTSDLRVTGDYLLWEDDTRPSTETKTFRVKNLSSDTANSILVAASDEYAPPTPSPASQIQFSLDGSTWASTVTIASVSPGGASGVIYMRRTTPADSPLGSHSVRVDFTVGSWS